MNLCQIPDDSPKGTVCAVCGVPIPVNAVGVYRRQCGPPATKEEIETMKADAIGSRGAILSDYNRAANGALIPVESARQGCQHLGGRLQSTESRLATCGGCWTPLYQCTLHGLCTPFGRGVDAPLIYPCDHCDDYVAGQFETPEPSE